MTVTDIRSATALPQSQDPRELRAALKDPAYAPWHDQIRESLAALEACVGDAARFGLAAE
ncbi:hypothetical protein [Actinoplanes sp. NPDC051494]|uniref:hypothetical protein n=1 Tax=Actinoplanes sp. NPDC051494 TaxID=3363907 RepID=UPI0037B91341